MGLTAFSLLIVASSYQSRSVTASALSGDALDNRTLNWIFVAEIVLAVLISQMDALAPAARHGTALAGSVVAFARAGRGAVLRVGARQAHRPAQPGIERASRRSPGRRASAVRRAPRRRRRRAAAGAARRGSLRTLRAARTRASSGAPAVFQASRLPCTPKSLSRHSPARALTRVERSPRNEPQGPTLLEHVVEPELVAHRHAGARLAGEAAHLRRRGRSARGRGSSRRRAGRARRGCRGRTASTSRPPLAFSQAVCRSGS